MIEYPKYGTTIVGAHGVPDWYEALGRLVVVARAIGCPRKLVKPSE
jgi:hypothetical protein